jgi:ribosome-binding ATPase YchF (GTP1/OBG family)
VVRYRRANRIPNSIGLRLEGKEYEVADGDVMHFRLAT